MLNLETVVLNLYGTRNNTHGVVTDISNSEVFFKTTGGLHTKKGREKNSVKVSSKILDSIIYFFESREVKNIIFKVRCKGDLRENKITKGVKNILKNFPKKYNVLYKIDKTPVSEGFRKNKGGRRGRRT